MSGDRTLALLRRCRGGVAAAAVAVALAAPGLLDSYKNGLLESYELALLDRFFEYRGTRAPTAPIVIISIDEASLVEVNQPWPFPRATHARLIDAVAAGNPLAIGVDLIFDQPSAFGADDDAALGAAVARAGNVVLVAAPVTDHQGFITRQIPNLPVAAVRRGAAVLAALNLTHDQDSKVRRAPQRVSTGVEELPGFALALHRLVAKTDLAAAATPVRGRGDHQLQRAAPHLPVGLVLPRRHRRGGAGLLPWQDRADRPHQRADARRVRHAVHPGRQPDARRRDPRQRPRERSQESPAMPRASRL